MATEAEPLTPCADCGVNTSSIYEYGYMVNDDVWAQAGAPEYLCVGCLEARLGRPLYPGDFNDAPLNWWRGSARLTARR